MLFSCCPRLRRRIGVIGATVCLALGLVACGGDGRSENTAADSEPASVSVPDTASLWSVLQTDDRFSTLATAIDSARLDSQLAAGGPLVTRTAPYTGRSPKDRFIVRDASVADQIN